jgi:TPR repeat protein
MTTAFLSYARVNRESIPPLVQDLEALGLRVWCDNELTGGQVWWDRVLAEIRSCDCFVFALSPESLESVPCKCEYEYAASLHKSILPVLIAEGVFIDLLPGGLARIQHVDYRRQDREAMRGLSKAVRTLPAPARLPDPLPEPPAVPVSYLGNLKEQIEAPSLSYDRQTGLLIELKQGLRNASDAQNIRGLLKQLRARRDLYASVAEEIDALLVKSVASRRTRTTVPHAPASPERVAPAPQPVAPPPRASAQRASLARQIPPSSPTRDPQEQAEADFLAAKRYYDEENFSQAAKLYRKAADQGHAAAQNNLGEMYEGGEGVATDEAEAVKWYRKAADQDYAVAQKNLGEKYKLGRGVAKDGAEAEKWYRSAADLGDTSAQTILGLMYYKGEGVAIDEAEAVKWIRRAADQGDAFAIALLARLARRP